MDLLWYIWFSIFGSSHLTHFAWLIRFSFVNLVWLRGVYFDKMGEMGPSFRLPSFMRIHELLPSETLLLPPFFYSIFLND